MRSINNTATGILAILGATFLYGFFGILTRTIGTTFPPFFQAWIRNLGALVVVGLILIFNRQWKKIQAKDWPWIIGRSATGLVAFFGSFFAFLYLPIGLAYFIFYGSATIFSYLVGLTIFRERLTFGRALGLVLSLIGLTILYAASIGPGQIIFLFSAVISGLGVAFWNTLSKKVSDHYSAWQLSWLDFVISFVITFILSIVCQETWVVPTLSPIWIANSLMVVMFLITGYLMIVGFKHLDTQLASLLMLTEILFGIILSGLLLHESVSLNTAIGGIIILTAIITPEIASWSSAKAEQAK